ncbi:hypothetical protein EYE40_04955 [Glaciihabitans arcticus]|uniref:Uncharacterized protein n=1 Tax=Glaciihabitans arcticus TaxID=2668039 RepID=A0A4Q9GUF1_9MICO|nr:hypothetical protein [Glaciihabitans arcticus]TBN56797.1 hypothetical protein EYE40_04955 [Glaciihabitans arcticus]
MTDAPPPPPSAESPAIQRLRASLAAVNENRLTGFFTTERELFDRVIITEARSLVLAEYTIYLLDRIEKLEARLADVPHT